MTTAYSLPPDCFYLDQASATTYAASAGTEVVVTLRVNAAAGDALDAWIQRMWLAAADKEITPGEGRGFVNHTRFVAKLGLEEKIEAAGVPSPADAPGAVPSILYRVTHWANLPIVGHIALVRFVPHEKETEIVWTIKLQLAAQGSGMFADPAVLPSFLETMISRHLAGLAETIDAEP